MHNMSLYCIAELASGISILTESKRLFIIILCVPRESTVNRGLQEATWCDEEEPSKQKLKLNEL